MVRCSVWRKPVLDIGCAFGIATLAALETGATVVANDIDPQHLAAVWSAAPKESRNRLRLLAARFPSELDFEEGALGCVHASNVLNFLSGAEIDEGFQKIASWLAPGGIFLSMSGSPYAANVRRFIPVYERRKAAGEKWPGECGNLKSFSSDPTVSELPDFLHLLDPGVLARSAGDAGLEILEAAFFHRRYTPAYIHFDGRENVVLIARKPRGQHKHL